MYAIIETGGKQYRVEEGSKIVVEKLAAQTGSDVTLDKVLMVGGSGGTGARPQSHGLQAPSSQGFQDLARAPSGLHHHSRQKHQQLGWLFGASVRFFRSPPGGDQ